MRRVTWLRSWRRLAVQAGLLAGLSLAFVGPRPRLGAVPPPDCQPEATCGFKKPLLLFLLDYSTSMNAPLDCGLSRWQGAVKAVQTTFYANNGFVASHFVVGLMRFGHDPDPQAAGTPIPGDTSGLRDGFKLDHGFYDPAAPNKPFFGCEQSDALDAALAAIPAPLSGEPVGIESWTRGALQRARAYFNVTRFDHPGDEDRLRSIVMITDGPWTDQKGAQQLAPAAEDPAPVAAALFDQDGVPLHVITLGEAAGQPFADALAASGGTGVAVAADSSVTLADAMDAAVSDVGAQQVVPACAPKLPRVMVLLDASSSMLNLQGGAVRAPIGQGGWESARDSLAGDFAGVLLAETANGRAEELGLFGLAVFGGAQPDESEVLVQYGPCHRENFEWALDPASSCVAPGCNDPYDEAPIVWTYRDGSMVGPLFAEATLSHVPLCNPGSPPNKGCFGSGTATHLGLLAVQANLAAYKAACAEPQAPLPCDGDTKFVNVLITDGLPNSTMAQYSAPLVAMFDAGVTTHVIGLGDGVDTPQAIAALNDMAAKGSGGQLQYRDANNQLQLQAALADIVEGALVPLDPCCKVLACETPFPVTAEPDPLPPEPTIGCSEGDSSSSSSSTGGSSTGASSGDPGGDSSSGTDTDATTQPATLTEVTPSTSSGGETSGASESSGDSASVSLADPTTTDAPEPEPTTTTPTPTSDGPPPASGEAGDAASTAGEPPSADDGCGCRARRDGAAPLAVLLLALRRRSRRERAW
ncbi:MAG: flagellar biosynthesis protein P [Myxococcales bacterium]|nr:flagellar biosynthesis protein P [Myxococcales bacterium]